MVFSYEGYVMIDEEMKKKLALSDEDVEILTEYSVKNWDIILGSSNDELCETLRKMYDDDVNVNLSIADNGCDLLVMSAQDFPHVVIVDEDIPCIHFSDVIKCMKSRKEFSEISLLCALKSDESECMDIGADDYFNMTGFDSTYISRKISNLLFASDHVPPPKRRWSRKDVNMTANLVVTLTSDPENITNGTAIVENISRTGAYLKDIYFEKELEKTESYNVLLKIDESPLNDWEAESQFVSMIGESKVGLRFTKLSKKNHIKISTLIAH
ncbi:hypothetical protein ACFL47_04305 [Candidatus Latescibacterota bacterium]